MVTIGRHVSKVSGYAPALPTPFDAPTIVAPHGPDNPHPQRRRATGAGSDRGAHVADQRNCHSGLVLKSSVQQSRCFSSARTRMGFGLRASPMDELVAFSCASGPLCGSPIEASSPGGCAIMFLSERFELDVENKGNPFVAHVAPAKRIVSQLA